MRASEVNLNFDNFLTLKMPERRFNEFHLRVNEKGDMSINSKFLEKLKDTFPDLLLSLKYQKDYSVIAFLEPTDEIYKFPKTGRMKHLDFRDTLKQAGISLPATYIIDWNSNHKAWVGCLQEIEKAPKLDKLAKKYNKTAKQSMV